MVNLVMQPFPLHTRNLALTEPEPPSYIKRFSQRTLNNHPPSPPVCCHISGEHKETALSMSFQGLSDFSDWEICDSTGISERSPGHLRNTYRNTGGISHASPGQFRMLTRKEVKVCGTTLELFFHNSLFAVISLSAIASSTSPASLPWNYR